jgi:hypothetical protein
METLTCEQTSKIRINIISFKRLFKVKALFLIFLLAAGCMSKKINKPTVFTNRITPGQNIMIGKKTCNLLVFQGVGIGHTNYLNWKFISAETDYYFCLKKLNSNLRYTLLAVIRGDASPNGIPLMQCFKDTNITNGYSYYRLCAVPAESIYLYNSGERGIESQIIKVETNNKHVPYNLGDSCIIYIDMTAKHSVK